jgi:hypothetical protein
MKHVWNAFFGGSIMLVFVMQISEALPVCVCVFFVISYAENIMSNKKKVHKSE